MKVIKFHSSHISNSMAQHKIQSHEYSTYEQIYSRHHTLSSEHVDVESQIAYV